MIMFADGVNFERLMACSPCTCIEIIVTTARSLVEVWIRLTDVVSVDVPVRTHTMHTSCHVTITRLAPVTQS